MTLLLLLLLLLLMMMMKFEGACDILDPQRISHSTHFHITEILPWCIGIPFPWEFRSHGNSLRTRLAVGLLWAFGMRVSSLMFFKKSNMQWRRTDVEVCWPVNMCWEYWTVCWWTSKKKNDNRTMFWMHAKIHIFCHRLFRTHLVMGTGIGMISWEWERLETAS